MEKTETDVILEEKDENKALKFLEYLEKRLEELEREEVIFRENAMHSARK